MSQKILQVNLKFSIPRADLEAAWLPVAQPIADVPGLRWKIWLMNETEHTAGSESRINALTYNYSGTFKSQGLTSFENQQKDIHAAFDFIQQSENIDKYKIDTNLIYLGGWCHGGGMALAYISKYYFLILIETVID